MRDQKRQRREFEYYFGFRRVFDVYKVYVVLWGLKYYGLQRGLSFNVGDDF